MWKRGSPPVAGWLLPALCLCWVACGEGSGGGSGGESGSGGTSPSGGAATGAASGITGGVAGGVGGVAETIGGAGTSGAGAVGATNPTGGVSATGGTAPTGGASSSGGVDAGGAATGGAATGGATSSGPCSSGTNYPVPDLSGTPTAVHSGSGSGLFEGVVWLDRGVLLFSDMDFTADVPPSTIHELTPPSSVQVFAADAGTNGLGLAPDGTLLGCAHDVQGIVRIDPVSGARTTWVDDYQGNSFNSPNDIAVRSDGVVYFSDPNWQLGSRTSETGITGLYRVSPDGVASLVDDTLANPNGVTLAPDQTMLYVGEEAGTIWRYSLAADGEVGAREPFATGIDFPDGMGIDCGGNLYVADHQVGLVRVFAPDGSSLGTIDVASSVTNVAFGGEDRTTLYVSAGKTIYGLPMNLPGYPY